MTNIRIRKANSHLKCVNFEMSATKLASDIWK